MKREKINLRITLTIVFSLLASIILSNLLIRFAEINDYYGFTRMGIIVHSILNAISCLPAYLISIATIKKNIFSCIVSLFGFLVAYNLVILYFIIKSTSNKISDELVFITSLVVFVIGQATILYKIYKEKQII